MDWLTFISTMTGHIAWPTSVAVIAALFHKPIGKLIIRMRDIEFWGAKTTFADLIQKGEAAKEQAEGDSGVVRPESAVVPDDPFLELAERYPVAAVLEAYRVVEDQLLALKRFAKLGRMKPTVLMLRYMQERGYITESVLDLYNYVSGTRNAVAHGRYDVTAGEAILFRDQCEQLAHYLEMGAKEIEARKAQGRQSDEL